MPAIPEAKGVEAFLYESAGDFIKQCLVGDPLNAQYNTFLQTTDLLYETAAGMYQAIPLADKVASLYTKLGALYEMVANVAISYAQKATTPEAAAEYYAAAYIDYRKAQDNYSQVNDDTNQKRMALAGLVALFNSVTQYYIGWYQVRWQTNIFGKDNFDDLYSECGSIAPNPDAQKLCQMVRKDILTSLVYVSSLLSNGIPLVAKALNITLPSSTKQDDNVTAYLTKNNAQAGLYTLLSPGTMKATDIAPLFMGLVLNGNANQIDSLASNSSALAPALSTTQSWAAELYDALGESYVDAYERRGKVW